MPIHIKMKVMSWSILNGSLNKKTPSTNMIVGPIYCINPVNDNGIRLAPAENRMSGTAVTAPDNSNQNEDIL